MPNFSRVISQAYARILGRLPDPGGLDSFNQSMNQGMTEAAMREALLRSPEYAEKNPDAALAAARRASRTRKAVRPKKPSRRR
jgi:predicted solute-binding protein